MDLLTAALALPPLTADLPGIGGFLKQVPADFEVEEIPAYPPCGEGTHLYLWIEKINTAAEELTKHISRRLGVSASEIGVAGMKDKVAVTRQFVSIPAEYQNRIGELESDQVHVLHATLHRHKLRTGHLQGNRFSLLLRDPEVTADLSQASAVEDAPAIEPVPIGESTTLSEPVEVSAPPTSWDIAQQIAARLNQHGFPNYYGLQRFGIDAENITLGLRLLQGQTHPSQLPTTRRKFLLRLALSSVQSALFNASLARRLQAGQLEQVLRGDVLQKVASGGIFICDDPTIDQPRFEQGEIVPAGPLYGPKLRVPQDEVAIAERQLLAESGLTPASFQEFSKITPGARRAYLVRPGDLEIVSEPEGLRFRFTLPAGSYATVLMAEFQKSPATEPAEPTAVMQESEE